MAVARRIVSDEMWLRFEPLLATCVGRAEASGRWPRAAAGFRGGFPVILVATSSLPISSRMAVTSEPFRGLLGHKDIATTMALTATRLLWWHLAQWVAKEGR
jgi:hypothetical protein